MRRGYPSDLTNAQWEQIAPVFAAKATGRPTSTDRWEIVNAILYMLRTGYQWRYLSGDFPPYSTVHSCTGAGVSTGRWTASVISFATKSGRQPGGTPSQALRL
jgi:transposase